MTQVMLTDKCEAINWLIEGVTKGYLIVDSLKSQPEVLKELTELPIERPEGIYLDPNDDMYYVIADKENTYGPYRSERGAKTVWAKILTGSIYRK